MKLVPSFISLVLLLIIKDIPTAGFHISECCFIKEVGNDRYVLVNEEDTFGFGCKSNCVYKKDSEPDKRYCFKAGFLPFYCVSEHEIAEYEPHLPMKSCSKNTEMTKNCIIYRCQMGTQDSAYWVKFKYDPTCCLLDDEKIENGETVEMDGVKITCRTGNLEISDESLKGKIEDESSATEEDTDLGLESYGENCINLGQQDEDLNSFYHDIFTKPDTSCNDVPPTKTSNGQIVFFYDGKKCSSTQTDFEKQETENLFSDLNTFEKEETENLFPDSNTFEKQETENVFPDLNTCIMACITTCQQPLEVGLKKCPFEHVARFYFDQGTKSCKQFTFLGCRQNRNNFETQQECETICQESDYGKFERPTPNDENNEICQDLEERIPSFKELKENILETHDMGETNNLNNIIEKAKKEIQAQKPNVNPAISGLSNSASMQLQSVMISSRPTAFQSIFGIFRRRLRWASVYSSDCVNIIVVIRYSCINNPFSPSANFNMVCNEVIPQGLKRYFERSFTYGTHTKNLIIVPIRTFFRSKKFLISGGCGRAGNPFPSWPVFFPFCDARLGNVCIPDLHMDSRSQTAAHELGHDVLWAKSGTWWSWTHKHTSTIWQSTTSSAPIYPPLPGISPGDLDLMFYYNDRPGQSGCDQIRVEIQGSLLAEKDAEGLVDKAMYRYVGHCGGKKCGLCLFGGMCQAGLRCHWLRCVDCTQDSHCSSSQYCWGLYNPFRCNECRSKKVNGAWCLSDRECINYCHGARCTECEQDHHCPSGQYCKYRNIPFTVNKCRNKKNNGAWCTRDAECKNYCDGARCTECERDSHCPPGHVCTYKNTPFVQNRCKNSCGRFCVGSGSCRSPCGRCRWFRCR